jgi:hypothetical protein
VDQLLTVTTMVNAWINRNFQGLPTDTVISQLDFLTVGVIR